MFNIIFLATQLPAMQSCLMSQIIYVERDIPVILSCILSNTSVQSSFVRYNLLFQCKSSSKIMKSD